MSSSAPNKPPKTLADWLALPDDARIELIDGEFVEKAAPTFDHGRAQTHISVLIAGAFDRKPGGPRGPNRATDTVTKLRRYYQAGVPHYWILDQVAPKRTTACAPSRSTRSSSRSASCSAMTSRDR